MKRVAGPGSGDTLKLPQSSLHRFANRRIGQTAQFGHLPRAENIRKRPRRNRRFGVEPGRKRKIGRGAPLALHQIPANVQNPAATTGWADSRDRSGPRPKSSRSRFTRSRRPKPRCCLRPCSWSAGRPCRRRACTMTGATRRRTSSRSRKCRPRRAGQARHQSPSIRNIL